MSGRASQPAVISSSAPTFNFSRTITLARTQRPSANGCQLSQSTLDSPGPARLDEAGASARSLIRVGSVLVKHPGAGDYRAALSRNVRAGPGLGGGASARRGLAAGPGQRTSAAAGLAVSVSSLTQSSTMASRSAQFFLSGTSKQFDFVLNKYQEALQAKADSKNSKSEVLLKLDKW